MANKEIKEEMSPGEGGVKFQVPTRGSTNWADDIENLCFRILSKHNHDGVDNGSIISSSNINLDTLSSKSTSNLAATGTFANINDSSGDPILDLATNQGAIVEYILKLNSDSQTGTLVIDNDNSSVLQEFTGDNISEVTFQVVSGVLQYKNANATPATLKYVIKRLG
jgi:hypothetical protein